MRAGEVLGEAWTMYKAHRRHLISIAFAFYALLFGIALLLALVMGEFGQFVGALIAFAGVFWVQGALVTAIEDVRDGRADLTVRETIAHIRPVLNRLSLAALGILIGIVIAVALIILGFILFIVPGLVALAAFIIFAVRWSLLVPVMMLEKRTVFGSLDRSQELVSGHTVQAFLVLLASLGFIILVAIVIGIALAPFDLPRWVDEPIRTVVSGTLVAPFAALALTLMYYRLRAVKEPAPAPEPAPAA
jgi:hypothetical protein